jgi:hypothetical protein
MRGQAGARSHLDLNKVNTMQHNELRAPLQASYWLIATAKRYNRRPWRSVSSRSVDSHFPAADPRNPSPVLARIGDDTRAFVWHHALLADAIRETADTTVLNAIADTLEMRSPRSYYARDWGMHHHVRGLVAMRGKQYQRAIAEFEQARWGVCGWSRSLQEIAEAALALNQPARAIAVLRDAYKGPLDAMGRYLPRSEIDFWMARAFKQAGQTDSAAAYAGYVRSAWVGADTQVRGRLRSLE